MISQQHNRRPLLESVAREQTSRFPPRIAVSARVSLRRVGKPLLQTERPITTIQPPIFVPKCYQSAFLFRMLNAE